MNLFATVATIDAILGDQDFTERVVGCRLDRFFCRAIRASVAFRDIWNTPSTSFAFAA